MCGIGGTQGLLARDVTEALTCAISHRGPDGEGLVSFVEQSGYQTHLGHRRLSIIDLSSAGAQPMRVTCDCCGSSTAQSGLTITYNGEIYNYRTLRSDLLALGHQFRSQSDTEVLLHAYSQWGIRFFERLNGIFALAIRDGRTDGRPDEMPQGALLLARDHLGVKPLYTASTPDGFLFCSELRPLVPYVQATVDPDAVVDFLQYLWIPSPRTIIREVRKVEPGNALVVHGGRIIKEWRYYSLPYGRSERYTGSLEAATTDLRTRLAAAVQRQMVSDVPIGAFLSGGVDSSAVAALMKGSSQAQGVSFYTTRFEDETASMDGSEQDLPYAREVAKALSCRLVEVEVRPEQLLAIEDLVQALDEPHADPAPANALLISRAAKADGISVLLSGAGGDDLFTGYRRHWTLSLTQRLERLPRIVLKAASAICKLATAVPNPLRSIASRVAGVLDRTLLPLNARIVGLFQWTQLPTIARLLKPDIWPVNPVAYRRDLLAHALDMLPTNTSALQRTLFLEGRYFLADHNLLYTDKMGMAEGVEIRVPLIDREVVEFAITLPDSYKQRGPHGKYILKEAIKGLVPESVLVRSKTGFGVPLRRWMSSELAPLVDEVLSPERLTRRGIFDSHAVRQLIEADRAGAGDNAYLVYALLSLEVWLSQVPEVRASDTPAQRAVTETPNTTSLHEETH
jgi:asparagine synthase (glutamine-hydrolyzing)